MASDDVIGKGLDTSMDEEAILDNGVSQRLEADLGGELGDWLTEGNLLSCGQQPILHLPHIRHWPSK